MDDLVSFLRARLDEDEAAAKDAVGGDDGIWGIRGNNSQRAASTVVTACGEFGTGSPGEALHIVCHDPARVLRDVEAGRKILAIAKVRQDMMASEPLDTDLDRGALDGMTVAISATLIALAEVYADHPDYLPEWKP